MHDNKNYNDRLVVFKKWLGNRSFSPKTIIEFLSELSQDKKPSTVHAYKVALHAVIRQNTFGIEQRAVLSEFFKQIKTSQPEQKIHQHMVLSRQELDKLLEDAGEKTSLIIKALYESAARVSELLSIRLQDCQVTEKGVICLIRNGKGGKSRNVYLAKETYEKALFLYRGSQFLFENKGKPLSRFTVHRMINRAGRIIGKSNLHPHTLRHSKATHMLFRQVTLPSVSAYLGHADSSTTARYYLHDSPSIDDVLE